MEGEVTKKKIYLIDDDPILGKTVAQMLREYTNYEIRFFSDIKMAMGRIKKHKPDLVLLDWVMPEMTGIDILRKLKKDKETKDISVFIMTGKKKGGDFLKACSYDADGFITKPVDIHYMKNRLVNHLQEKYNLIEA